MVFVIIIKKITPTVIVILAEIILKDKPRCIIRKAIRSNDFHHPSGGWQEGFPARNKSYPPYQEELYKEG